MEAIDIVELFQTVPIFCAFFKKREPDEGRLKDESKTQSEFEPRLTSAHLLH
jgi:hypothetical protein